MRPENIPIGFCQCGCGERTKLAPWNDSRLGVLKGQPRRFIANHHGRLSPVEYIVYADTGCWVWQRALARGYGRIGKKFYAHRVYYERLVGPIPEGLQLDHLCRNRACVNPEHLEPVTQAENLRRAPTVLLNVAAVREIKASDEQIVVLAKRFGVSPEAISHVRHGRNWKDVE